MVTKQKCKECKSTMTYVRLKTNQRVCRHCGHIEELENDERRKQKL